MTASAGDTGGSIPQGTKIPQAMGKRSLCAAITRPAP